MHCWNSDKCHYLLCPWRDTETVKTWANALLLRTGSSRLLTWGWASILQKPPHTPNPQPLPWPSAYHRPCYGSSKKKTVGEEHHVPMGSFKRKGLLRENAISSPFSSSKKFHSVVYNIKNFQIWEPPLLEKLPYLLPLAPYHPFAPYSALYSYSIVYSLMY